MPAVARLQAGLLAATLCLAPGKNAVAQHQTTLTRWSAPVPSLTAGGRSLAVVPDSVRRKVGYQHWEGAAIGGAVGAGLGSAFAFGLAGRCADCTMTSWERVQATLFVTGVSGVFGFLVGLASPKYAWQARPDTSGK
jgi:hypothetical protein